MIVGLQPLLPATDVTGDIQLRFDGRNLCATRTFQQARLSFYIIVCRNDDPTHPPRTPDRHRHRGNRRTVLKILRTAFDLTPFGTLLI